MTELLLDARTINAVLKQLNQPVENATAACALVRSLAVINGLKISDDEELSGGDFEYWHRREGAVARAVLAVSDLEDYCHQNEAEWSGWGDGEVPDNAVRWTEQAKLAKALVQDELKLGEAAGLLFPRGSFHLAVHQMLWENSGVRLKSEPHIVYSFDGAADPADVTFWSMNAETDDLERHAFTAAQILATDWEVVS